MKIIIAATMLIVAFLAGGIESANAQRCPRGNCDNRPTRPTRPTADRPTRPTRPDVDRPTRPTRPNVDRPTRPTRPVEPTRPTRPTRPDVDRPTRPTRPDVDRPTRPTRPNVDRPTRPTRPTYDRPTSRPTTRPPTNYRRPRPNYYNYDQRRQALRNYHRAYSFRANYHDPYRAYVYYNHSPYYGHISHSLRFYSPYDYYSRVPYRNVYWDQWVRWGVSSNNGFYYFDNYPYFVYNGYRHRYSPMDSCNYELVDGYDNRTEMTFSGRSCQSGYDACARERDERNYRSYDDRYFCSERLDSSRSYNWDYNDDFYSDLDYYDYDDYYYN